MAKTPVKTTETETPETVAPAPEVAISYPVLSTIDHNQKRYDVGDVLAIDTKTAEPLLAVGAIGPAIVTQDSD